MVISEHGKHILLLFSKRIGDAIFCTPGLEELRRNRPELAIDAVALSKGSAEVLAFNPVLRRIYIADEQPLSELLPAYDTVLAPHDSGAARRYAGKLPVHFSPHLKGMHASDSMTVSIARHFGYAAGRGAPYRLYPQPEHYRAVDAALAAEGVRLGEPLVGLHLGSRRLELRGGTSILERLRLRWSLTKAPKALPLASGIALVERFREQAPEVKFVLTGSSNERFLARPLQRHPGVIDLIGRSGVLELAALMRRFCVFVTGDTGPLHVACAMDTPLVAVHAETSPGATGPRPPAPHRLVIEADRLTDIPVSRIAEGVSQLLNDGASPCTRTPSEPGPNVSATTA